MPNYEPLQERAFTYLKKLIASGGLTPGVIYSETRIASEIGISRTPVKDALARLQSSQTPPKKEPEAKKKKKWPWQK